MLPATMDIPRRPDPATQPALTRAFDRMFGDATLRYVDPDLVDLVKHDVEPSFVHLTRTPASELYTFLPESTTRAEKSQGWCGASIVADHGKRFVQVYGEWCVPAAMAPPGGKKPQYFSATWIGLDGDRRYLDATLPQVGTQQNTTNPVMKDGAPKLPEYYVWFQWWAPRRIAPHLWWVRGVPVDAGDDVMGLVWAKAQRWVAVAFCNFTKGVITGFSKPAPLYTKRPSDEEAFHLPTISGATAEWIVERPTEKIQETSGASELLPFARLETVVFRNCVAGSAEVAGESSSEKVLVAPRFKRMYETLKLPSRTRLTSMPRRGNGVTELVVEPGGFPDNFRR